MKSEFRTKENEHDNLRGVKCFHPKDVPINCTGRIIKTSSLTTHEFPVFQKAYINELHSSPLANDITFKMSRAKQTNLIQTCLKYTIINNFNIHKCNITKPNKARNNKFGRMGELRCCHKLSQADKKFQQISIKF
jgi:hypothetical protein